MNSTFHRSISTAPFELRFGTRMNRKGDLDIKELLDAEFQSQFVKNREDLQHAAKQQIIHIQEETKNFNRKRLIPRKHELTVLQMATRWGIVSVGKICHDFVSVLRSLPKGEHQVVASAARDLDRAKNFNNVHEIPKAYGSYEELAKDKNVEIAYVGVLNRQHFEVGKMMLENGKHLLLEKPMGINLTQTQEIISIAKKNNRFLMEGIWSRFFPVYKQLADELSRCTIGEVVHVNVMHGMTIGNEVDRIRLKSLGGGGILDIGVYAANALCFVYGEKPLKVKALGEFNHDGVDQGLVSSLLYSKGRTATAAVSTVSALSNEVEIIGTKGKIKISNPYHCPTEIITPEKVHHYPLPDTVVPCNYMNSSGLRYEATAVRECLKKGLKECPQVTHKDSEMNAYIRDEWKKEIGLSFPEDLN